MDTLRAYSLYADSSDWDQLEAEARTAAAGAVSIEGTYRFIDRLLRRSGDRHAWFRRPAPKVGGSRDGPTNYQNPTATLIDDRIGYLVVPAAMGRGHHGEREYAATLQTHIRLLDANARGWVVDLRSNWGGNMWPMIAGLGPLLGDGVVGSFVYPNGERNHWSYDDGGARLGDSTLVRVDDLYELSGSNRPIAVLVGNGTTSSGEAIVVAFRGLAHARSFGSSTSGMSTAIESKRLCDGSMLGISTAAFADRFGTIHRGPLPPDVPVEEGGSEDRVLETASLWIMSEVPAARETTKSEH